jgi:hypothetical protein
MNKEIKDALRLALVCADIGLWKMAEEYTDDARELMQLRRESECVVCK